MKKFFISLSMILVACSPSAQECRKELASKTVELQKVEAQALCNDRDHTLASIIAKECMFAYPAVLKVVKGESKCGSVVSFEGDMERYQKECIPYFHEISCDEFMDVNEFKRKIPAKCFGMLKFKNR